MEQKINIAELLKDAPKGTKLYSTAFGDVELLSVRYTLANAEEGHKHNCTEDFSIECEFNAKDYSLNHKFGTDPFGRLYRYDECPCVLFPSKDCRTWENFKAPRKHKTFEPFQKVLVKDSQNEVLYRASLYSHYFFKQKWGRGYHVLIDATTCSDEDILPYAGNEKLLGEEVEP